MKNKFCIVKTTCGSKKEADFLANLLIKQKLAACVQIKEIESCYLWQEKFYQDKEFELSIKTTVENYLKVEEVILANHSYEVPQILAVPIWNGSKSYLDWVQNNSNK